jgi:hypothetical protein
MGVGELIIPRNGSPKQLVFGCLVAFGLFVYLCVDGISNKHVGWKAYALDEHQEFYRDKTPIRYWLVIAFYGVGALGAAWLIIRSVPG